MVTRNAKNTVAGTETHECIVASQVDGPPISSLFEPALQDLAYGLKGCDIVESEWCAEEQ